LEEMISILRREHERAVKPYLNRLTDLIDAQKRSVATDMDMIRLEWRFDGVEGFSQWVPDTPEERAILLLVRAGMCKRYGAGTHWIANTRYGDRTCNPDGKE
jgi:hypothetical protein